VLPVDYSEVGAVGAADTDPVSVSGILTGDELLAVISWAPGEDPAPLDTTDYTVADGTITGATIDSSGALLWVMWIRPKD
jgi:ABC-type sugar transport system substrate-binding protein